MNWILDKKYIYWIGLFLGSGLFLYQLSVGIHSIKQGDIYFVNDWIILFIFLAALFAVFTQMFNWQIILTGMGIRIPFIEISKGYVYSFLPRYIPGSVWGYLSRGEWLRQHGVEYSETNTASFIEILTTFISGIVLIGVTFNQVNGWGILKLLLLTISLPILTWLLIHNSSSLVINLTWRWSKFFIPVNRIDFKTWWVTLSIYFFHWLIWGIVILMTIQLISPFNVDKKNIISLIFSCAPIFALGWMVGFLIPFIPAGLGVRELIITSLLSSVIGLSPEQSTFIATFVRIIYLLAEFLWLIWAITLHTIRPNKT